MTIQMKRKDERGERKEEGGAGGEQEKMVIRRVTLRVRREEDADKEEGKERREICNQVKMMTATAHMTPMTPQHTPLIMTPPMILPTAVTTAHTVRRVASTMVANTQNEARVE